MPPPIKLDRSPDRKPGHPDGCYDPGFSVPRLSCLTGTSPKPVALPHLRFHGVPAHPVCVPLVVDHRLGQVPARRLGGGPKHGAAEHRPGHVAFAYVLIDGIRR